MVVSQGNKSWIVEKTLGKLNLFVLEKLSAQLPNLKFWSC